MKLESSRQIFEKYSNINLMKICSVKVELFHADRRKDGQRDGQTERRTDMTKLIVAFADLEKCLKGPNIWKFSVALGLMVVTETNIRARHVKSGMEIGHQYRYVLYLKLSQNCTEAKMRHFEVVSRSFNITYLT
jgi:hypothetical protein